MDVVTSGIRRVRCSALLGATAVPRVHPIVRSYEVRCRETVGRCAAVMRQLDAPAGCRSRERQSVVSRRVRPSPNGSS
jgi:hypothetical protein